MARAVLAVLIAGLVWFCGSDRARAQAQTQTQAQAQAQAQDQGALQTAPQVTRQAAPPAGAEDNGRYSFHRMGDGFVRLDSRTGQLAQCSWGASGWSCKVVPDERAALESEIARLQRQNAELKKSLLSRGLELPGGITADAPAAVRPVPPADIPDTSRDNAQQPKAPSEADLDRAIAFMKSVWRRLVEMMAELQRDIQRKG